MRIRKEKKKSTGYNKSSIKRVSSDFLDGGSTFFTFFFTFFPVFLASFHYDFFHVYPIFPSFLLLIDDLFFLHGLRSRYLNCLFAVLP